MKYQHIRQGTFLSRPNRFIAYVEVDGKEEKVHVKNTGRCRELLKEGAVVYLEQVENEGRSTAYDLVAVEKDGRIVNMDSQAPNKATLEWLSAGGLFSDITYLKPETTFGDSRFDFYIETADKKGGIRKIYMEVKGCTLEEG